MDDIAGIEMNIWKHDAQFIHQETLDDTAHRRSTFSVAHITLHRSYGYCTVAVAIGKVQCGYLNIIACSRASSVCLHVTDRALIDTKLTAHVIDEITLLFDAWIGYSLRRRPISVNTMAEYSTITSRMSS